MQSQALGMFGDERFWVRSITNNPARITTFLINKKLGIIPKNYCTPSKALVMACFSASVAIAGESFNRAAILSISCCEAFTGEFLSNVATTCAGDSVRAITGTCGCLFTNADREYKRLAMTAIATAIVAAVADAIKAIVFGRLS